MGLIEDVIDKHWRKLKKHKGVLSVKTGSKFTRGKDTFELCITVYVKKKIDKKALSPKQLIPERIEGVKTDVVELYSRDFMIGETSVSKKSPKQQKIISGGVQK